MAREKWYLADYDEYLGFVDRHFKDGTLRMKLDSLQSFAYTYESLLSALTSNSVRVQLLAYTALFVVAAKYRVKIPRDDPFCAGVIEELGIVYGNSVTMGVLEELGLVDKGRVKDDVDKVRAVYLTK